MGPIGFAETSVTTTSSRCVTSWKNEGVTEISLQDNYAALNTGALGVSAVNFVNNT
jgi:hypothetical protein